MIINMNDSSINRIEDIREFLNTSEKITGYSRAQTALVHNNPNGMALKSFLGRAYDIYEDVRFKTIRKISVSYLVVIL